MINEIFFGLLGFTGGLIIEGENCFMVNPDYRFMNSSEVSLLNQIVEIGYNYKVLKDFVTNYREMKHKEDLDEADEKKDLEMSSKSKKVQNDPYFQAMPKSQANTAKVNKLYPFAEEENKLPLEEGDDDNNENNGDNLKLTKHLSLYLFTIQNYISSNLQKYEDAVESLEESFYDNDCISKTDIIAGLSCFNHTFIRVIDFIQFILSNELKGAELLNLIYESLQFGDKASNEFFKGLYIEINVFLFNLCIEYIIEGKLQHTENEFFIVSNNVKDNEDMHSWNLNFFIESKNIPHFFPLEIVELVLFIGKGMKILNSSHNYDKLDFVEIVAFNNLMLEAIETDSESDLITEYVHFSRFISELQKIKATVATELWRFVVEKRYFFDELKLVKNILLTFEGEFFEKFISLVEPILDNQWDYHVESDLNTKVFKKVLEDVYFSSSRSNKRLSFQSLDQLWAKFSLKLVKSGFELRFDEENIEDILKNKDLALFGNIKHETYSNSIRFLNSVYNKQTSGSLWNLNSYDLDNEFIISFNFVIKNYSKKGFTSLNDSSQQLLAPNLFSREKDPLKSSQVKKSISKVPFNSNNTNNLKQSRMDIDSNRGSTNNPLHQSNKFSNFKVKEKSLLKTLTLSFILHLSKTFKYSNSSAVSIEDLCHYFEFTFCFKYDYAQNNRPIDLAITIAYVNKILETQSKIGLLEDKKGAQSNTIIFSQVVDLNDVIDSSFCMNDQESNITLSYKDNILVINLNSQVKSHSVSLPLNLNAYLDKSKRKIVAGIVVSSSNIDVLLNFKAFLTKFFSAEIFNENMNLILIDYNPEFPFNFLFHEGIRKNYNQIFNVIFPIKTCVTLLNHLWIKRKKYTLISYSIDYERFERKINTFHSELITFLNSLIYFFMSDIIEPRYKLMVEKMEKSKDFETFISCHEHFLTEIVTLSFVKSKRLMNLLMDILSTIRRFHSEFNNLGIELLDKVQGRAKDLKLDNEYRFLVNNTDNIDTNFQHNAMFYDNDLRLTDEIRNWECRVDLTKSEYREKKRHLISSLTKIKKLKYYQVISLLLSKIDSEDQTYSAFFEII